MSTAVAETEIKEVLSELGIQEVNSGASTGAHWFNTRGEQIDSYSPVDGKLIASVKAATSAEYEACIRVASRSRGTPRIANASTRARNRDAHIIHSLRGLLSLPSS